MSSILVTGANGFIGRSLTTRLVQDDYKVRGTTRSKAGAPSTTQDIEACLVGEIGPKTDWKQALDGIDTVVHLAARVHVMKETTQDPDAAFNLVNVEGTAQLAKAAVDAGVSRFIFLSSIKVNGESTDQHPFTSMDTPAPLDPYGRSKLAAEKRLQTLCADSTMDTVIIRPPLVYGPGVGGNFIRLMKLVNKGIPLPLGAVKNQRSLVFLDNLTDLIAHCIGTPQAPPQPLLVSDGEDMGTPQLIQQIATAMGVKPRLIPVPVVLLRMAAALLGRRAEIDRLCDSLQVDIGPTCSAVDWTPPISIDDAMIETARWYQNH